MVAPGRSPFLRFLWEVSLKRSGDLEDVVSWTSGRQMYQGKCRCAVVRERCKVDDLDAPPPESETTQACVVASSAHEARVL